MMEFIFVLHLKQCSSLLVSPSLSFHALNIKYKFETITVNKMLTLRFQALAANDLLFVYSG